MFGRTSADAGGELLDAGPEVPHAFDGAAELLRAWCDGLRPDPDLTDSAYVDKHRILSPGASTRPERAGRRGRREIIIRYRRSIRRSDKG